VFKMRSISIDDQTQKSHGSTVAFSI
jgi:hypothetical protein